MANVILILGQTGSGKSTSIRSLNADETVIFNVLNKRLPFKGGKSLYSEEKKNLFYITDCGQICKYMTGLSERVDSCKNIIIDDATYLMRNEMFARAKETGYAKFTDFAMHFQQILATAQSLRDDINVFIIMHAEEVVNGGSIDSYKCATVGRMLDEKYNPMECVSVCLFCDVKFDGEQKPVHGFYTNIVNVNGKRIPAKSPDGMFAEDFIPNDLQLVVDTVNEYYN